MRKNRETIIIGAKYNYLTIVGFSHSDKRNRKWYDVVCDCGNRKKIMGSAMVSDNTKSCGCYGAEVKRKINLLPDNGGIINQIILSYKRHAKDRNISYELDRETFSNLIKCPCHYCGLPPSNLKTMKNGKDYMFYSGIDRVDSKLGYSNENCVSCCDVCNKAKLAVSKDDFLEWIKRVYIKSILNKTK